MKFDVRITETNIAVVEGIEANSPGEAEQIVDDMWHAGYVVFHNCEIASSAILTDEEKKRWYSIEGEQK